MCTIIILHQVHPQFPVVIAANRDERYDRAARPPRLLRATPPVVAGVDVSSGGSWLGVSAHGFFVGITNQRTYELANDQLQSRGPLVRAALLAPSVDGITELVQQLDGRQYNSFNLLWGNTEQMWVAYGRSDQRDVELQLVPHGIHALPNDHLDSSEFPKAATCRAAAQRVATAPWDQLTDGLRVALGSHTVPDLDQVPQPPTGSLINRELARKLQAMCVHTSHYGTRSSAIIALQPGLVAHYLHADGPPCTTDFRDVTAQVNS